MLGLVTQHLLCWFETSSLMDWNKILSVGTSAGKSYNVVLTFVKWSGRFGPLEVVNILIRTLMNACEVRVRRIGNKRPIAGRLLIKDQDWTLKADTSALEVVKPSNKDQHWFPILILGVLIIVKRLLQIPKLVVAYCKNTR